MKKTLFVIILMVFLLSACNIPQFQLIEDLISAGADSTQLAEEVFSSTEVVEISTTDVPEATEASETQPVVETPVPAETQAATETSTTEQQPVLLFGIGMHVEPFGESAQGFGNSNNGDYNDPVFFRQHVQYIRTVANIVASHGGVMTVQVQSPFTETVILTDSPILRDLVDMGFEIALHFHEDAHLGKNSSALNVAKWCDVMKQEINLIKVASGVEEVHYWSGGNLYPRVFDAAACAGLTVNSDWKSPATQSTDSSLLGINPWRPAGGTDGNDFSQISNNDPDGPIVFLPEGMFDREDINSIKHSEAAGGDEAYFAYLEQTLMASLAAARSDRVNVFHFTMHAAEFHGDPADPFAVVDKFLTEVVDPLVASGQIKWATYSQMEEAYTTWEAANPGVDPRS